MGYDIENERDRPLSFDWHAPNLGLLLGLPPARNAALERSMSSVLACAILAVETGQRVSYSRRTNFYANSSRYRGTAFTYVNVLSSIAALDAAGLIIDARSRPGRLGRQSIFVASDELIDAWDDQADQLAHHPGEIIRLKNTAGELIDYRDTRETRRMRSDLDELNEYLAGLLIDVPGAERRGHHMVFKDEHGADYYVLPKPSNALYRVFSRGSFEMHGRAYGWFQNVPKAARASLTINGEPVVEADYRSLHPTILYNQAGIRFSGDAYDVDGFERSDVKVGFNVMVNARNRNAAIWAVADAIGPDAKRRREEQAAAKAHAIRTGNVQRRQKPIKREFCSAGDRRLADSVITALEHLHKPIKHRFSSDAGVGLMRIDSELALGATKAMNDNGAPALPVHDALIVPARFANQATAKMVEVFEQIVGTANPCTVSIKGDSSSAAYHKVDSAAAGPPPLSALIGPRPRGW